MVEPLCRACKAMGKIEHASIADHIQSHRGNWMAFLTAELQSLCKPCHDAKTEGERNAIVGRLQKGCDVTGMPIDRRHWAWIER